MADLSLRDARHVALAAQGFGARTTARVTRRVLAALVDRLGCVQIDSVNVVARSHYLPFFSRLGAYDVSVLNDLLYGERRAFAEYWAHEASIVPFDVWPLLRWRMERARSGAGMWRNVARVAAERPDLVAYVRSRIAADGPLAASEFEDARSTGSWWGWSDTKRALEYSFWAGYLTTRRRRTSFEREYDLVERVLPPGVLAATVGETDAIRALALRAARALGIATERDLRDYFRLDVADARRAVAELLERGELARFGVEGWRDVAYAVPPLRIPRTALGSAFLSPFDNLVWNRPRAERLFGFDYRIEIYTPVAKRVHGYYVLPYLVDGKLVARVDLKHDRASGTLRAHAVTLEDGVAARSIAANVRADLETFATWLGASKVACPPASRWR